MDEEDTLFHLQRFPAEIAGKILKLGVAITQATDRRHAGENESANAYKLLKLYHKGFIAVVGYDEWNLHKLDIARELQYLKVDQLTDALNEAVGQAVD